MAATAAAAVAAPAAAAAAAAAEEEELSMALTTTSLVNPPATAAAAAAAHLTTIAATAEEERGDLAAPPMHGSSLRVAYQGVPGAYSEAAACKAYPGCEAIPCDQFDVAFQSVELWLADRAVLPVENSLGGSIHRNYDLLLAHRLHIVGEVQLAVRHCLLALPGVAIRDIRRVISHPQALAQCEGTLSRLLSADASREAVDDTAGAAQFIAAHSLRDTAAVASSRAAQIYGMQILAQGIQDDSANVTRFVMLARDPVTTSLAPGLLQQQQHLPPRPFKTSIAFRDSTATLFKVLAAFAFRGINLTKIESRPSHQSRAQEATAAASAVNGGNKKAAAGGAAAGGGAAPPLFDYLFYIDFEASVALPAAQNALAELEEFVSFVRVLGSYPMDTTSPLA